VRAFAILYNHFGHTPSVDVFLNFFEAKGPGKKLWVSFNEVAGRVLLTLCQQSYKCFKGKFFKVCYTDYDLTLLDGFPLYWVKKLQFKKPRTFDELTPHDCELYQVFASLGAVFNTAQLIKYEFSPSDLKGYIGTCSSLSHFVVNAGYQAPCPSKCLHRQSLGDEGATGLGGGKGQRRLGSGRRKEERRTGPTGPDLHQSGNHLGPGDKQSPPD